MRSISLANLVSARAAIVECERCARLRAFCSQVAREKRAAFRDERYWGRPVPGFGDANARVLILGLAPAAHGANRTGRVFTGDGTGGSGDFLMAALHRAGFANIPTSHHADDGLELRDVYIAAAVRCAPPDNRPLPEEIVACANHLDREVAALPRLRVVVALGKIAWDAWFQHLVRHGVSIRPRPAFAHGATFNVPQQGTRGTPGTPGTLIGCFHPSRQNTNTRKVTAEMYDCIFGSVLRGLLRRR
ncbi:MAG TPA: uracil-DNA glycosylase [Vicinamibacterales bacterium]|nr:uracil-DNA glycosylase [Vicinamibacterales bacterium]